MCSCHWIANIHIYSEEEVGELLEISKFHLILKPPDNQEGPVNEKKADKLYL